MDIDGMTSKACLNMISERARKYRLEYPMTQKELAEGSGVSLRCIQLFESGADIKLSSLIKIMGKLGLKNNFSALIPDMTQRPSDFLSGNKTRKRVYTKRNVGKSDTKDFKWGDEK